MKKIKNNYGHNNSTMVYNVNSSLSQNWTHHKKDNKIEGYN